jgi:hypothetical protein
MVGCKGISVIARLSLETVRRCRNHDEVGTYRSARVAQTAENHALAMRQREICSNAVTGTVEAGTIVVTGI